MALTETLQSRVRLKSVDMLLVESVQSMANRLEEVCLQGDDYNTDCQGIPYVRVLDGTATTHFSLPLCASHIA